MRPAKLHSKTGKIKVIGNKGSPQVTTSSSISTSNESTRDSEADRQFELELCWCIHQLQTSVNSGKLNEKQIQEVNKTLKILKSDKQPVIKKRQLMRASFGDYRTKMLDEEKKMSMNRKQIKFNTDVKQKSFFIKKSFGKDFKFNFTVENLEQLNISQNENTNNINNGTILLETRCKSENFQFLPSDNLFKFNFNIDSNES